MAFAAMYGKISYTQHESQNPFGSEPNEETKCLCPDANNPVVFKTSRIREK